MKKGLLIPFLFFVFTGFLMAGENVWSSGNSGKSVFDQVGEQGEVRKQGLVKNKEWFSSKLPSQLVNASGKRVDTVSALKGKTVALYFSASWCGPCRGFTPHLVKFYNAAAAQYGIEVVLISFDRSEKNMYGYMNDAGMPWLAVPFEDGARRKLSRELKVNGIPRLVVFAPDGRIISPNARSEVSRMGVKAAARWTGRAAKETATAAAAEIAVANRSGNSSDNAGQGGEWFSSKLPSQLVNASGKRVDTASALKGKMVAFYFSASWCGPCRGFTPKLVSFYKRIARKHKLEIVLVSSDKSAGKMAEYMKKDRMPWLAVPYNEGRFRQSLQQEFRVRGIPHLTILDPTGKIISPNGRWDVAIHGDKAIDAWKSPNYKPATYQDYKSQEKSTRKKSRFKRRR